MIESSMVTAADDTASESYRFNGIKIGHTGRL